MSRKVVACAFPLALGLALLGVVSCRTVAPPETSPMPDLTPTTLDYVDGDGFDALFEAALVNQDPVIVVRTGRTRPDWTGRLNAWVAAWNRSPARKPGRRAEADAQPTFRGQSPLAPVPLDGDAIREFRLLVNGLLDRVEEAAGSGATWWAEERARSRRVALLKPYSLRFHMDEEGLIQLVFFHGSYAAYYPRHMQQLMKESAMPDQEWSRCVECSGCCKRWGREKIDRLTGRGGSE